MRSKFPTLVTVRITVFEHMTLCHLLETDKHLEGTSCLQFQSRICRQQCRVRNVSLANTDQFHHWEHFFKPLKLQGQERN